MAGQGREAGIRTEPSEQHSSHLFDIFIGNISLGRRLLGRVLFPHGRRNSVSDAHYIIIWYGKLPKPRRSSLYAHKGYYSNSMRRMGAGRGLSPRNTQIFTHPESWRSCCVARNPGPHLLISPVLQRGLLWIEKEDPPTPSHL